MKGRGALDKFYISQFFGFIFNLAYKQYEKNFLRLQKLA